MNKLATITLALSASIGMGQANDVANDPYSKCYAEWSKYKMDECILETALTNPIPPYVPDDDPFYPCKLLATERNKASCNHLGLMVILIRGNAMKSQPKCDKEE